MSEIITTAVVLLLGVFMKSLKNGTLTKWQVLPMQVLASVLIAGLIEFFVDVWSRLRAHFGLSIIPEWTPLTPEEMFWGLILDWVVYTIWASVTILLMYTPSEYSEIQRINRRLRWHTALLVVNLLVLLGFVVYWLCR